MADDYPQAMEHSRHAGSTQKRGEPQPSPFLLVMLLLPQSGDCRLVCAFVAFVIQPADAHFVAGLRTFDLEAKYRVA